MTIALSQIFVNRISGNLSRKAVTKASEWAQKYRIMSSKAGAGLMTFDKYPWSREMHDVTCPEVVGQKAAQVGFTETCLDVGFFNIDINRTDVLYILPNERPDAQNFSASRFNAAVEMSPYLQNMFSDVNNVGHKRAGANNFFIRGSRSRSGLKNLSTGLVIMDEFEEMDPDKVQLAELRASGQDKKQIWKISTPWVANTGINVAYLNSSQEHFMFHCPGCSKIIELQFPDNVEICGIDLNDMINIKRSFYKCNHCQYKLDHELKPQWLKKAFWQATNPGMIEDIRGFNLPQMYSPAISAPEIVKSYFVGVIDPLAEQEFYNSRLGKPHVIKGSQVTEAQIAKVICPYDLIDNATPYQSRFQRSIMTMGADVGSVIHYQINLWEYSHENNLLEINYNSIPTIIQIGTVVDFEDLHNFMRDYCIKFCVIDANPETRLSMKFVGAYPGRAYACFYGRGQSGRKIVNTVTVDKAITVDRTSWIDMYLSRFIKSRIKLPRNITYEYKEHVKCLVAGYEKDSQGDTVRRYVNVDGKPDHYAHAGVYSELALPLAFVGGRVEDIK